MTNEREISIPEGKLYDANFDERIVKARQISQELCHRFNQLSPSQEAERDELLTELLGKKGEGVVIVAPFYCDYGTNVEIGDRSFLNTGCVILDGAKVKIGHDVFVAPNCGFYTASHPLAVAPRVKGLEYAHPITIGDNVWIGGNVTILPGVTIGEGAVIGAGSVVTKDIPPYALAYGNPCRVVRIINQDTDQ